MSGVIEDENNKKLKFRVKEMEETVKSLEDNMKESDRTDSQIVMSIQNDKIKYEGINNQLQEALKENQHLLNLLQKCSEQDISRTNSQGDVGRSCSTMSIVHLQYKYEELMGSHSGLLKLLDIKSEEIKRVHDENVKLKVEIEELTQNLSSSKENFSRLSDKFSKLKGRKNVKINKLRKQRETLQMVHNQLVSVLHKQCMEKDGVISNEIKNCMDSEKALLLQEIRKNNMMAYENFQLNQKVEFLKSFLGEDKLNHH